MASASPEQQSAARAMKNYKPGKSAKPGKIDRHRASLAKRGFFVRMGLMSQLKNFQWTAPESSKAVSSACGTLRATALQSLSVLLKKLSALFGFGAVASGSGASGGGGSTLRSAYSGCDPPGVNFDIGTNNTIDSMVKGARKAVLGIAAAVAMGYGVNSADASLINDIHFSQNGGQSYATFNLQNNNSGVTYDSAELKYDELLTGVAQAVKDNNPDYADKTLDEIKGEWDVRIRGPPTGEVASGWSANRNSGVLDLSHNAGDPNDDYTVWNSTSDNADQDEMAISVDFFDQLDFNHNGSYDSATEALQWNGAKVTDAFTGYNNLGQGISSDANAVTVIPEPTAIGLIGLAGAGLLAARRIFGMDYRR